MEKYIVIDTETANSMDDPLCYDIGWAVVDQNGTVYEKYSFAVADIFLDSELMQSAYFIKKVPKYWDEIKNGDRLLARFSNIKKVFRDCVKANEVKKVFAHNMRFDYRALNLTNRYITSSKYRYFFPYGLEICDTLKMSRQVLKSNDEYKAFCEENEYKTKNGQNRYTAEIIYRFLTQMNDFEEKHTGLEDVLIEKEILKYCIEVCPEVEMKLWKD